MAWEWSSLREKCSLDAGSKLVFIGGGNMARALVLGAVNSQFASKDEIVISVRSSTTADKWKADGFDHVFTDNNQLLSKYAKGPVFICVKPQMFSTFASAINKGSLVSCPLIISIMAGVSTQSLNEKLSHTEYANSFVRLMPSTSCRVSKSASLVCFSSLPDDNRLDIVTGLAKKVGTCTILDEKQFNAGSAVASCAPAWVFVMIEALADGGVLSGLARSDALALAAQSFAGAAALVQAGGHPAVLKDEVCSPGGTTVAGLRQLEKGAVRGSIMDAVAAATERALQLP